jgi:hypothetical protein
MFKEHPNISTPSDVTVLWRYVNLEKLIALLCDNKIYLCRLDRFRDPWEGVWTRPFLKAIHDDISPAAGKMISDTSERLKTTFFANCWHSSEHESAALWDLYSGQAGISIRTTVLRLKSSIDPTANYYLGNVTYCNYDTELPPASSMNAIIPCLLKRKSFEHEREVRIITNHFPVGGGDEKTGPDWSQQKEFDSIEVDLSMLIESIYIAPNANAWLAHYVKQILTKFDLPDVPVVSSELYNPYLY